MKIKWVKSVKSNDSEDIKLDLYVEIYEREVKTGGRPGLGQRTIVLFQINLGEFLCDFIIKFKRNNGFLSKKTAFSEQNLNKENLNDYYSLESTQERSKLNSNIN